MALPRASAGRLRQVAHLSRPPHLQKGDSKASSCFSLELLARCPVDCGLRDGTACDSPASSLKPGNAPRCACACSCWVSGLVAECTGSSLNPSRASPGWQEGMNATLSRAGGDILCELTALLIGIGLKRTQKAHSNLREIYRIITSLGPFLRPQQGSGQEGG